MCRLFGFKATHSTNIRFSLVHAVNALRVQSASNPDGWGVGFYESGEARIIKRPVAAEEDTTFLQLSDRVRSDTVIAHVRKSSVGSVNPLNCHPFRYKHWIFAHNGTFENSEALAPKLKDSFPPEIEENIAGNTDSELCFHVFLSMLAREFHTDPAKRGASIDVAAEALITTIRYLDKLSLESGAKQLSRFNFMISDGRFLMTTRRGAPLFLLQRFLQSDSVGMWATAEQQEGMEVMVEEEEQEIPVRSVLVASEPITSESWTPLEQDHLLIIDHEGMVEVRPMQTLLPEQICQLEDFLASKMPPGRSHRNG